MHQIENRVRKLEKLTSLNTVLYGTTISRVLLDHSLFEKCGLDLEKTTGNEASIVWCLALGAMHVPKELFYGHTIEEAIEKAKKSFEEWDGCNVERGVAQ